MNEGEIRSRQLQLGRNSSKKLSTGFLTKLPVDAYGSILIALI